jgi:hypothetical protein
VPYVRHRNAVVAVVALSLTSALLIDEAHAQSVPTAGSNAPATPMLPLASQPAAAEENGASTAPVSRDSAAESYALEGSTTSHDRAVYKPPASTRWLLIGAGLGTTGAFYGATYGIGALWSDAPGKNDLKIPVAGPFMDLAHTGCPKNNSDCSTFELVVRTVLVSLDALGQAGGVGLLLEGALFSPSGIEPPRTSRNQRLTRTTETPSVIAVPWTDGQTGLGLGLAGRF